jgi:hypothetical protein
MRSAGHNDSMTVPKSVTSPTREGLRLQMLKINTEMNSRVFFQDISYVEEFDAAGKSKRFWVAWYYEKIELSEVGDLTNGTS